MSSKSNPKRRSRKSASDRPDKPYPEYPLYTHPLGYWSKKIDGQIKHFGRWGRVVKGKLTRMPYEEGWQQALALYKAQVDNLQAGRGGDSTVVQTEEEAKDKLTVKDLCNAFLTAKLRQLESGELASRTFKDYRDMTDRLIAAFGKRRRVDDLRADDFAKLRADIAKEYGLVRLGNSVQQVRTIFKYAYDSRLIDRPIRLGPEFRKPGKKVMRKHRKAGGKKCFTADEIRQLLAGKVIQDENGEEKRIPGASIQVRAMILLGINCGFGNSDCASLPQDVVDLNNGWIDYARPKTGIDRRCPLWPETVEALRAAIAERPEPKDKADAELVFVTKYGKRWVRERVTKDKDGAIANCVRIDGVALQFGKQMRSLSINGRRGLGFYSLRHSFRTVADATKDFPAIRLIMGHADGSIDDLYREQIEDERLIAATEYVRQWLFGDAAQKGGEL
jgi:integrase